MPLSDEPPINVLLLGDSGVGKTCLISRFADEHFNGTHIPTIGTDFKVKTILLNGQRVRLQVWDTAGLERFHSLTTSCYRRADAVLLVYDITDGQSFDNLAKWLQNVNLNCREHVSKLIVGNKRDRIIDRKVAEKCGREYANQQNSDLLETSAVENINVSKAFFDLAEDVITTRNTIPELSSGRPEQFQLLDNTEVEEALNDATSALLAEQLNLNCTQQRHTEYMQRHDRYLREHDITIAQHRKRITALQSDIRRLQRRLPVAHPQSARSTGSVRTRRRQFVCCTIS